MPKQGYISEVTLMSGGTTTTAPTTNTNSVAEVVDWEIPHSADMIDITELGDTARRFMRGLRSGTARIRVNWDADDTSSQQDELLESLLEDDFGGTLASATTHTVQVNYWIDRNAATKPVFYGQFFVSGVRPRAEVGGQVQIEFDLTLHGLLRYTTV